MVRGLGHDESAREQVAALDSGGEFVVELFHGGTERTIFYSSSFSEPKPAMSPSEAMRPLSSPTT